MLTPEIKEAERVAKRFNKPIGIIIVVDPANGRGGGPFVGHQAHGSRLLARGLLAWRRDAARGCRGDRPDAGRGREVKINFESKEKHTKDGIKFIIRIPEDRQVEHDRAREEQSRRSSSRAGRVYVREAPRHLLELLPEYNDAITLVKERLEKLDEEAGSAPALLVKRPHRMHRWRRMGEGYERAAGSEADDGNAALRRRCRWERRS